MWGNVFTFIQMHEMETHLKKATFRNDIKDVIALADFINEIADEENIAPAISESVNLALEEAVVNVINYAYPKGVEGTIVLESNVTPEEWKFRLVDSGESFDPTKADDVDVTLDIEDRPVGGLGIFLVKQIMDNISYERNGNENILTMTKKLENK